MALLTLPTRADGLRTDVLIGHDAAFLQALQTAGRPLPAPASARGLFDTGSDVTCVVPGILSALGLSPTNKVWTQTASGSVAVDLYDVSLTLFDPAGGPRTSFFRPAWTVMGLPHDLPTVDALIGMDLINELVLTVDGPARRFTLAF
jgi:hypothetical protein